MERNCVSWPNMSPNWLRSQWWGHVVCPQLAPLTLREIDFKGIEKRATPSTIKCKSWDWHETNWKAKTRSCCKLPISETNKQPTNSKFIEMAQFAQLWDQQSHPVLYEKNKDFEVSFPSLLSFITVTINGFAPLLKLIKDGNVYMQYIKTTAIWLY